jgi:hypothetical protein
MTSDLILKFRNELKTESILILIIYLKMLIQEFEKSKRTQTFLIVNQIELKRNLNRNEKLTAHRVFAIREYLIII